MSIQLDVAEALVEHGLKVAVVETTAGGLISGRITSVPGSSKFFLGGIIAYSRESKTEWLGLAEDILSSFGAVSPECACAMAVRVRRLAGSDLGLAETGIAGPVRGRSPKPIGASYIALAYGEGTEVRSFQFCGDRSAIRESIVGAALELLLEHLTRRKRDIQ